VNIMARQNSKPVLARKRTSYLRTFSNCTKFASGRLRARRECT
jgi:hypothetical protein